VPYYQAGKKFFSKIDARMGYRFSARLMQEWDTVFQHDIFSEPELAPEIAYYNRVNKNNWV